ncbi:MAG: hypothetical protein Kow00106_11970 [Anaerolineae bacterium]
MRGNAPTIRATSSRPRPSASSRIARQMRSSWPLMPASSGNVFPCWRGAQDSPSRLLITAPRPQFLPSGLQGRACRTAPQVVFRIAHMFYLCLRP